MGGAGGEWRKLYLNNNKKIKIKINKINKTHIQCYQNVCINSPEEHMTPVCQSEILPRIFTLELGESLSHGESVEFRVS